MSNVRIENKWIDADFVEVDTSNFDKQSRTGSIYLIARIFPFQKISRNRIMYNREYAEKTKDQIIGLNLHHNHITDGEKTFPRGEWIECWIQEDGLYGKAKVYETSYNEEYIEWLQNASNVKVSLQVNGEAKSKKDDSGKRYQEAYISEWKEISTVNIPGFIDAGAKFSVMAEKLLQEKENEEQKKVDLINQVVNVIENKL